MNPRARLEKLLSHGACLEFVANQAPVVLALVSWEKNPQALKYVGIHAEHQGDIHRLPYDNAMENGRDVLLLRGSQLVAAVVPVEEAALDVRAALDSLTEWRRITGVHNNAAKFGLFFEEN